MNKIYWVLALPFFLAILIYALTVFVILEPNVFAWSQEARFLLADVFGVTFFAAVLIVCVSKVIQGDTKRG